MKSNIFQNLRYFLLILIVLFITIITINFYIINFSKNKITTLKTKENIKVGLVLGAGIKYNKIPTDILKDRLNGAYKAYKAGIIKKILVSGDNSKIYHNEPDVMKNYLVSLGIPEKDIYTDCAGFNTYSSVYRAKEIFGVKDMIIFTQEYHLYRSIYIANKLGIKSFGIACDFHKYKKETYFKTREILSRIKAFFEVEFFKPKPKFLGNKIIIK